MSAPVLCTCGRTLPVHRPPRAPATTCSYWCNLVRKGTFTAAQVEPMLLRDRGPVAVAAEADTLPLDAS